MAERNDKPHIRTMFERMEDTIAAGIAANIPTRAIATNVLQHLINPPLDVIVQGCHALEGGSAKRRLQDAEYSGECYEKARLKMTLRWRAMIKSIMAGM